MWGLFRRLFRIPHDASAGWWVYERVVANWVLIASLFGGGIMSYLAIISDWLDPWGPIGWGAAGLGAFFLILFSITLIQMGLAWKRTRIQLAEFTKKHMESESINPLHDDFERIRLKAWDFYHPYLEENHRKSFRLCEIVGPCNVLLNGFTQMVRPKYHQCEFVIIDPSKRFKGVVAFNDASFSDCSFYRITFFIDAQMARSLKAQILETGRFEGDGPLNVITDGNYGEI